MRNYLFFFIALISSLFLFSCKKEINKDKDNTPVLKIGDEYAGGLVFYIDATGQHGLVSAKSGLGISGEWGCKGDSIVGTKTEFGTGQANTQAIIAGCTTPTIAARIVDALVHNGYSDWFIPSKDELSLMYTHRDVLEFYTGDIRFSSSQMDRNNAWAQTFAPNSPGPAPMSKSLVEKIRVVRAF